MASDKDIMSQEEIDAMMGVDPSEADAEEAVSEIESEGVRAYDLASQDRIVRSRMPTLEILNERFARYVRTGLFSLLRRTVDVDIIGLEIMKYSDYIFELSVPTSMNMTKASPLRGTGLVVMGSELVYKMVDRFFGGSGIHTKIEGREFTVTELRFIQKTLAHIYDSLEEAWMPVKNLKFEFSSSEVNPAMCNILNPTEAVVVSRFQVDIEGFRGDLHIVYPYAMLEPIRDILMYGFKNSEDERDERWQLALQGDILNAPMDVNVLLAERKMKLSDVIDIKEGDIIPVVVDDFFKLNIAGVPMFKCKLGASRGMVSAKITDDYIE